MVVMAQAVHSLAQLMADPLAVGAVCVVFTIRKRITIVAAPAAETKKLVDAPPAAITNPPMDGATIRVVLYAIEMSGTADGMCDRSGSKRGKNAVRLGSSIA